MTRTPVTSSQIDSIGFDATTKTLEIAFHGRKDAQGVRTAPSVYQYKEFPADKWAEFQAAESKGKYFGANIKGRYAYTKTS